MKSLRELEQGTLATGPQQKLKDYLEDWIENVHKDELRISAYVKYKKLIKYIVADLGNIWLQKLSPGAGAQVLYQEGARMAFRQRRSTRSMECCTWRWRMPYGGTMFRGMCVIL